MKTQKCTFFFFGKSTFVFTFCSFFCPFSWAYLRDLVSFLVRILWSLWAHIRKEKISEELMIYLRLVPYVKTRSSCEHLLATKRREGTWLSAHQQSCLNMAPQVSFGTIQISGLSLSLSFFSSFAFFLRKRKCKRLRENRKLRQFLFKINNFWKMRSLQETERHFPRN